MFWAHAISRQDDSEADGIHLLWAPPRWAGYSVGGFDIWRRESRGSAAYQCYELTAGDLTALETRLRAETPPATIALRPGPCPAPLQVLPDEPYEQAPPRRPSARIPMDAQFRELLSDERARAAHVALTTALRADVAPRFARVATDAPVAVAPPPPGMPPSGTCLVYEFRFRSPVNAVRLVMVTSFAFALALREEKVVDSAAVPGAYGVTEVEFRREAIDRVIVWLGALARGIQICWSARDKSDDESWNRATLVARGVQLPLRELQPGLATAAQEVAEARSRLLPGEDLGPGEFKRLSETMNAALRHPGASPVHALRMVRETQEQSFLEIAPWGAGLSLTIAAAWRRALGFGFLDRAEGLRRGATYDYRIVGRFRRRDLEEHLLGFHTVPLGTPLPRSFRLGRGHLDVSGTAEVVAHPPVRPRRLGHPFRKGLRLDGLVVVGFGEPQSRLVLELEPAVDPALTFRAMTTDLIPGLPITIDAGNVPNGRRVELTFTQPVTRVELRGKGLLYGVRYPSLAADADPDEIVEVSAYVTGVRFEKTPAPEAPPLLGTVNLQQPPPVGDPEVTTQEPPHFLGFRLNWLPPSASATWPPGWWPPDVAAAPPTEIVGFEIERRRIDTRSAWVPFDRDRETRLNSLVGAARSSRRKPASVRAGDDLLSHFPEVAVPTPPVPVLAEIDDVLNSRAGADGIPPGSQFQYRIRSVDVVGRRSQTPTTGSVVRLEKRVPPPQPVGPTVPADETRPIPRGVRARLLQANNPFLTAEDEARLNGRANAVLLEWGWTDEERRADPWAREFRLYWQPNPPDLIHGEVTGPATLTGSVYEVPTVLSHDVTTDQFVGEFIRAGSYSFPVAGHAAGNAPVFRLEPSQLGVTPQPVPGPGTFQLGPALTGEELRPAVWAERTHVEPINGRVAYEYVFPHVLPIDAEHPRARVWVGVSAADDQAYRPDIVVAGRANGGRPGNEGSIVPAVAEGRWFGRPVFQVPPPLPDVPTLLIPEVAGDEVMHEIDVPGLMPALPHPNGISFRLERLSAADLTGLLAVNEAGDIELLLPEPNASNGVSTYGSVAHRYEIANAADRAALAAAIRTGKPARIENRFLMDLAIRFVGTTLENFWRSARPDPMPYGPMMDRVPNKAERFLYRLRWIDAAGRASENVAFVPRVFRVPSLRVPAVPRLVALTPREDSVRVVVRAGERFDVTGILVFVLSETAPARPNRERLAKPQLLRTPNRPDLYPAHGIRLRLSDGTLLAPIFAPIGAAAAVGLVRTWTIDRVVGYGQSVTAWVAAVTRDGVPSVVAGPDAIMTPIAPPPVPALVVTATALDDQAAWAAVGDDITYRLERSLDTGATWQAVSPWLPAGATSHAASASPAGRLYRLRTRRAGTREATGDAVAPA